MRGIWVLVLLLAPLAPASGQGLPMSPCAEIGWIPLVDEPFALIPNENFYRAQITYNVTYGGGGCNPPPCFAPSDKITFEADPPVTRFARYEFTPNPVDLGLPESFEPEPPPSNNLSKVVRRAVTNLKISIDETAPLDSRTLYKIAAYGCGYQRLTAQNWITTWGNVTPTPSDILQPPDEAPGVGVFMALAATATLVVFVRQRTR